MAYGTDIQAKLGIDTSSVGTDLAGAKEVFNKWGQDVANDGSSAGTSYGDKFTGALERRILGQRILAAALVSSLGLSVKDVADTIAGAITDGTGEAWKKAGEVIDENTKLIQERAEKNLNPAQLIARYQKDVETAAAKVNAIHGTVDPIEDDSNLGLTVVNPLTAAQLDAQQEALKELSLAQNKLDDAKKKQADEARKNIAEFRKDELEAAIKGDVKTKNDLESVAEVMAALKKADAEAAENTRKLAEQKARYNALALEQSDKLAKDEAERTDKAKLTLSELANLKGNDPIASASQAVQDRFAQFNRDVQDRLASSDISAAAIDAQDKARQIQDIEQQAEEKRRAGDAQASLGLLDEAGKLKDELVSSGFTKSTEGSDLSKIADKIAIDTAALNKTMAAIQQLLSGRLVNE